MLSLGITSFKITFANSNALHRGVSFPKYLRFRQLRHSRRNKLSAIAEQCRGAPEPASRHKKDRGATPGQLISLSFGQSLGITSLCDSTFRQVTF
jgi:hypothetical protein